LVLRAEIGITIPVSVTYTILIYTDISVDICPFEYWPKCEFELYNDEMPDNIDRNLSSNIGIGLKK